MRDSQATPDILRAIPDALYDEASRLPGFGLYHAKPWHGVLACAFGWQVGAVVLRTGGGTLAGYMPFVAKRRFLARVSICLPFSHRVGPLTAPGTEGLGPLLALRVAPVEIHADVPGGESHAPLVETVLELGDATGPEVLAGKLNKRIRRNLATADKEGCTARTGTEPGDFAAFARLQTVTRRRQGSLDYPAGFFPALAACLAPHGLARVHLCEIDGMPVAATLTLSDPGGGTVYYGYGASVADREVWKKGVNQRAMWEAITWAGRAGAARFSFGSTPAFQADLVEYKERFGGITSPLLRTNFGQGRPQVAQEGRLVRIGAPVLRNMPLPLFRTLTPHVLKALA